MAIIITIVMSICIIIIISIVTIINPTSSYKCNECYLCSDALELISMFTEEELEGIFCGEAEVDLIILRKATIYESVSIHDR